MTREQTIDVIKSAKELTTNIRRLRTQRDNLREKTFRDPPTAPVKQTVKEVVPDPEDYIKTHMNSTSALALFLGGGAVGCGLYNLTRIGFFCVWGLYLLLGYFIYAKYKHNKEYNEILNSDDFKLACNDAHGEYLYRCNQAQEEYEAAMFDYNCAMKAYNDEKKAFFEDIKTKIDNLSSAISNNEYALEALYTETKCVPEKYRTEEALTYLYNEMTNSTYTLNESFMSYDRHRQYELDQQRLEEQRIANELADANYRAQQEANALAEEGNAIADKARRDANIAAVVGAVQRHNTNKYLKGDRK